MAGTLQTDFIQPQSSVGLTILNPSGNTITKQMHFVVPANSIEEARASAQEAAAPFINKVNGTFIFAE